MFSWVIYLRMFCGFAILVSLLCVTLVSWFCHAWLLVLVDCVSTLVFVVSEYAGFRGFGLRLTCRFRAALVSWPLCCACYSLRVSSSMENKFFTNMSFYIYFVNLERDYFYVMLILHFWVLLSNTNMIINY